MTPLFFNVAITGDCTSTNLGQIFVLPVGGTSPYNVTWVTPNLGIDLTVTSATKSTLSAGTYTIQVTDSTTPTPNQYYQNVYVSSGFCCLVTSVTNTTCGINNGIVVASTSNGSSFMQSSLYDSGDTIIATALTSSNETIYDNLSAGTYYIVGYDSGGCTGRSETFIIEESNSLDFGLYVVPNAACGYTPVGKIYITGLTGSPPYYYKWTNGSEESSITGLSSGDYSVSVTDDYGCTLTKTATIENISALNVGYIYATPPTCLTNNGSITIGLTGGTAPFYYSASTGYIEITYNNTFTLSGIGAGFYSFNITDAALCSVSTGTILNTPSGMTSVNVTKQNDSCSTSKGSISVSVVGGNSPITFTLNCPDSSIKTSTTNQQFIQFSNLSGGTYNLIVEDASGCTFTENYIITNQSNFDLSILTTGATYGQNNGIIAVYKTSGGTAPFTYTIDDKVIEINSGNTETIFYGFSSGFHTIKVTDFTGCTQISQALIKTSPLTDFFLSKKDVVSGNDGEINALISSGTPPFTYNWSDNISGNPQSSFVTGLSAGTYSLTIIDSNGSSLIRTTTINGSTNISSFQAFTMGEQTFTPEYGAKYTLLKMYNEGFQDLISGNTGCELLSATFTARVFVNPYGTDLTEIFYTSNSILDAPSDNLWYDTIKVLLMTVTGVGDVIIDEIDNQITIINDTTIVPTIDIKIYLIIDYNINCTG